MLAKTEKDERGLGSGSIAAITFGMVTSTAGTPREWWTWSNRRSQLVAENELDMIFKLQLKEEKARRKEELIEKLTKPTIHLELCGSLVTRLPKRSKRFCF